DGRHGEADLPRHEVFAAARRFVVEEDSVAYEHAVGFTIVGGRPMAEELGRRVRRSRPEWCGFLLRRLGGLAEHLGRAGLIEARLETALANAFENAEGPQARRVAGVFRNLEADFDVALRAQIVDLVRTDGPQQPVHR